MAFSVNNVLSNSSSSTIDCLEGKKSLLFLKNIVALSSSCGNFFSDYNWQNKVLGLTNRLKSLHKDPDSIGKELRVLKLVEASLESYSLKQIFYAALSETTGINQNSLAKDQEIHLNQIYTEQFLTWTQDEIEKLPQTSILLLLTIYHAFSDLSTCLNKNIWQELLSLSGWNESQKKSLNQFKSKYEFLTGFSSLNFPLIKLENTINTLEPVGIKKLKDQCGLWIKIIELLIKALDEEQKKYLSGFLDVSQTLLREVEKASDKDFIDGFKQLVKRILPKLKQTKKSYDKRISDNLTVLELYKQAHLQVMDDLKTLDVLQKVKKGFNALQMCTDSLKNILQNPSSGSLLGGQAFSNVGEMLSELLKEPQEPQEPQNAQSKVKEAQLVEKCKKEENSNFTLKKESILAVLFLSECLINLLEKESQRLKQLEEEKRIAYEAAIKKSEECYIDSFEIHKGSKQNLVERSPSLERDSIKSESDTEDSEEESSTGSSFDSSDTISQKF